LTTDATQDGPVVDLLPAWSEFSHVGVIQLTARRLPFDTSVKNWVCGVMMSLPQSGPL
jgi:hypothetical protein